MFDKVALICLLACCALFCSCNPQKKQESNKPPQRNVIKDYVKRPIDKANEADQMLQERNKRLNETADETKE